MANQIKKLNTLELLSFFSLFSLALFAYTSNAALNLVHIFILIPGIYYTYKLTPKLISSKVSISLVIFLFFAAISVLFSDIDDKADYLGKLRFYIFGLISVLAYYNLIPKMNRNRIRLLLSAFFLSTSVANINGIIGLFTQMSPILQSPVKDALRSTGLYSMAITYGYGIQFFTVICLFLLINLKKLGPYLNKPLFVTALISGLAGLYFSYSRGAILGMLSALPFLFLNYSRKLVYTLISAVFILIVSIVLTIHFTGGDTGNRIFQSLNSDSNTQRLSQFQAAWMGFLEQPLTGVGFRNFNSKCDEIKQRYDLPHKDFCSHAHSNLLSALVNTGILGFLSLLSFHLLWFFQAFRSRKNLAPLFTGLIVAFSVSGLFQNTFTDSENAFVIMGFFGLSQAYFLTKNEADAQLHD